jgi:MscS family membrane protein
MRLLLNYTITSYMIRNLVAKRVLISRLSLLFLLFTVSTVMSRQYTVLAQEDPIPQPSAGPKQSLSPRSSLEEFLKLTQKGDFESAAKFVELPSDISDTKRDAKIFQVAREINKVASLSPIILSDKESGDLNDPLPPHQEVLFDIPTTRGTKVKVLLHRVVRNDDPDMESWWNLPYLEVKKIISIGDSTKKSFKIESLFPVEFDKPFMGWASPATLAGFVIISLAALLATYILRVVVSLGISRFGNYAVHIWRGIAYPLQLFFATKMISAGLTYLELAFTTRQAVDRGLFVCSSLLILWVAVNSTTLVVAMSARALIKNEEDGSSPFLPLIRRVLNFILTIVIVLFIVDGLGFDVTTILAGLGVGGIAVALASQKTIENLFGGLVLFFDQPVAVGQFGKFGTVLGTIEDIGIRSTRIRTINRTKVSIPNADLIQLSIENFSVRDMILLNKNITLALDTTQEQLIYVLASIRALLIAHKMVSPDPARVKLIDVTPGGFVIEIFCYIDTADWTFFLNVQEDLWLRVLGIIKEAGVFLASPVVVPPDRTVAATGEKADLSPRHEVEKKVNAWRSAKQMPLPDVPPDEIARLRGTLTFPPNDSWLKTSADFDK